MKHAITFFFWLLLLGGGFVSYELHSFLSTPGSLPPREVVINIEPGATFDRVAFDLKKAGAITDVMRFRLLARYHDAFGKVRAGEYLVSTGWTPEQVLQQITFGQALLYRLSVREGLTWWETARAVESQGFARYEDFKEVIHDPAFLREHNIPLANAEGFLYPETYLVKKPRALDKAQAREIASLMVRMFWKKTEGLRLRHLARGPAQNGEVAGNAQPALAPAPGAMSSPAPLPAPGPAPAEAGPAPAPHNAPLPEARADKKQAPHPAEADPAALRQWLILASLVEKETGVPEERARVAGVYANRLRLNMLLQCDPTIIYGVGESFTGSIRRSQLNDARNLYNTYQHAGLPPGPICSPGIEALSAAAMPEEHDFLYFVATGLGGGHSFSKNLQDHNKAVQIYRSRMQGNR